MAGRSGSSPDGPKMPTSREAIRQLCMRESARPARRAHLFQGSREPLPPRQPGVPRRPVPGMSVADVIGKTDFDFFSEHARPGRLRGRTADHPDRRVDDRQGRAGDASEPPRRWVLDDEVPPPATRGADHRHLRDLAGRDRPDRGRAGPHLPVAPRRRDGLANRVALRDRLSQALALARAPARADRAVVHRPRRLQDDQRLVRPRDRRQGASSRWPGA